MHIKACQMNPRLEVEPLLIPDERALSPSVRSLALVFCSPSEQRVPRTGESEEPLEGIEPSTYALPRRRYTSKPQWHSSSAARHLALRIKRLLGGREPFSVAKASTCFITHPRDLSVR